MALRDFFVDMCMMDKRTTPDGVGGFIPHFVEGAHFRAGISTKQSTEAMIAYQQGLKTVYVIAFEPVVDLKHGDRVKCLKDGRMFRVTSDAHDMVTPRMAQLKMSQVTAEVVEE